MDSDRILVMADGEVAEFDTPLALLGQPTGMLRSLVDAAGSTNAAALVQLATDAKAKKDAGETTATLVAQMQLTDQPVE